MFCVAVDRSYYNFSYFYMRSVTVTQGKLIIRGKHSSLPVEYLIFLIELQK